MKAAASLAIMPRERCDKATRLEKLVQPENVVEMTKTPFSENGRTANKRFGARGTVTPRKR